MLYSLLLPPASKASQASARRLFKSRAAVADHTLARHDHHVKAMAEPLRNAVIVDLVSYRANGTANAQFRPQEISREGCMELLRTHIKNNVWKVGATFGSLTHPQDWGPVLSPEDWHPAGFQDQQLAVLILLFVHGSRTSVVDTTPWNGELGLEAPRQSLDAPR